MNRSKSPDGKEEHLVCMAEIVGVHGVKGWVKLRIFMEEPERLLSYSPFLTEDGKEGKELVSLHMHGNIYLAQVHGVNDRTAADKLRGEKLFVPRSRLPALKDEGAYYHQDLIGLAAKNEEGAQIGDIIQVANFGAGDLLEIKPMKGASYYVPFTAACVPHVDIKAGFVTVIVPPGLLD